MGFVRTDDDRIEITPDLQIQEAIRGVFAKFKELGSIRQALLWYQSEKSRYPHSDRIRETEKLCA